MARDSIDEAIHFQKEVNEKLKAVPARSEGDVQQLGLWLIQEAQEGAHGGEPARPARPPRR